MSQSSLIAVISPAKLLDDSVHYPHLPVSQPDFLKEASCLVNVLRKKTAGDLGKMMELSPSLATLNKERYANWHLPFTASNAVPSILMFRGEVYRGLNADTFTEKQLEFAQRHVRILSGLYGILRPLDLIQAYRLMMGTPFAPDKKHKNLYSYWGTSLASHLAADLSPKGTLVNLASGEYFRAVDTAALNRNVITCEFKEKKAGKYTIVSTYAKLARGMMTRFIIEEKITKPEHLKAFDREGYTFLPSQSTDQLLVFGRE